MGLESQLLMSSTISYKNSFNKIVEILEMPRYKSELKIGRNGLNLFKKREFD